MKVLYWPKAFLLVIKEAGYKFFSEDCFSRAAALAYSTLFALIPLTYFSLSMVNVFGLRGEENSEALHIILEQILPAMENETLREFQNNIFFYIEKFVTNIRALNVIAIAVFLCTGIALLNTIEAALNAIWKVSSTLSLIDKILTFCAVITLGPLFLALSIYLTAKFNILASTSGVINAISLNVLFFAPILVSWLAFCLLYFKLPSAKVRLRDAAFGAVVAAILFESAKLVFAHYVSLSTTYSKLYGVLATIPLFLFWLYVAWVIVLFGAEISNVSNVRINLLRKKTQFSGLLARARMSRISPKEEGEIATYVENEVGVITFYHPKGNALTSKLLKQLASAILQFESDANVRVIVLQSHGDKAFCAGASFSELKSIKTVEAGKEFFMGFAQVILAMKRVPKFVILRVQGKVIGGGLGVVASSDYALALDSSAVRLSELNLGLGPFVVGPAIIRKTGHSAFSSMAIDAEWRSASYAKSVGLFVDIFPDVESLDANVEDLVGRLAKCSKNAMANLKACLWQGTEDWETLLGERAAISGTLASAGLSLEGVRE